MVMETMILIRKKLLGRREKLIHTPTVPPQTNNISTKDFDAGLGFLRSLQIDKESGGKCISAEKFGYLLHIRLVAK